MSSRRYATQRRLVRLAFVTKPALICTVLAALLAGLGGIGQAYLVSTTIDRAFLGKQSLRELWPTMVVLLAIILARGLMTSVQEISAAAISRRARSDVRRRLFERLLALGPAFTRRSQSGELAVTMTDGVEALDAYYSQYLPQLAISIVVPASILLIVFPVDPLSGAILLFTAPLIPFFMYMIGRTAETETARRYETLGRLASHFLDSLQGLTTLKLFGQSKAHARNIEAVSDRFRIATTKVLQISFLSAFALELLATISTAVIAVEVGLRLLYAQLPFGEALFLLILAPEFYLPLRALGMRFHAGMNGVAAGHRIFEILDAHPQGGPPNGDLGNRDIGALERDGGEAQSSAIELAGVTFRYPDAPENALQDVNLKIPCGEHVALVGASGAGKTTLSWLVLGFLSPSRGRITLRSRDERADSPTAPAPLVGWVPQNPYLFSDTIAANIGLGVPGATRARIMLAAQLAHLHEFIVGLAQGYDTPIGDGGVGLSTGQAQRLALARAFLLDAPILVLDEPTASLDPESEARLTESIAQLSKGKTVVTIAHRLKTVQGIDEILVLDQGRIVERGSHHALQAHGGHYRRLLAAASQIVFSESASEAPFSGRASEERGHDSQKGSFAALLAGPHRRLHAGAEKPLESRDARVLLFLLDFLRGDWRWVGLSVLLASIAIGSSLSLMGTSAWLISAAALHPSIAELEIAIVGVRFFGIARAVFRYLERLASHGATFRLLGKIRLWVYEHVEPLPAASLTRYRAGDLLARAVSDVETLENLYVRLLSPPLTAGIIALGSCLFLALSGAGTAALAAGGLFAVTGLVLPIAAANWSRGPAAELVQIRSQLHELLVDGIQGLAELLAFGRGTDRLRIVQLADGVYAQAQRRMAWLSGFDVGATVFLENLALWSVLALGIRGLTAGSFPGTMLAPFALVTLAGFEAFSPLLPAAQLWPIIREAGRRLQAFAGPPEAARDAAAKHQNQQPVRPGRRATEIEAGDADVEIVDVTFCYPGRHQPAIKGLTLHIPYGSRLGIVGPSGAGKSTLASLLLRLREPDYGEILLAGKPTNNIPEDVVRAQMGYLDANPYVFDTSVFENIRLGKRGASRQEVEQAARSAQIHSRITGLPHGYDTLVGEHGARLSAGERQRLGLARMLLKDAAIWILDEPTAHLDSLTETAVLQKIFDLAGERTLILITHRLAPTQNLPRIVVLEGGQAVEDGSYAELSRRSGAFSQMLAFQGGTAAAGV